MPLKRTTLETLQDLKDAKHTLWGHCGRFECSHGKELDKQVGLVTAEVHVRHSKLKTSHASSAPDR